MQLVLKLWLLATVLAVAGLVIWTTAPVLVPIIAITVGLGGLVAVIVWLARRLERAKARGRPRAGP